MTDPRDPRDPRDADLSELLSDAVSDVEPHDRLDSIRNRTKVTPMSARRNSGRPWTYAVGGAIVATAAIVGAIAFATGNLGLTGADDGADPASQSSRPRASDSPQDTASSEPSPSQKPASGPAVAVYYVGDAPQGPRLYREFHPGSGGDSLSAALTELGTTPTDPDYRTVWSVLSFADVNFDGIDDSGVISVTLADPALVQRPAGLSKAEAFTSVQQVVYTLQAAAQTRAEVEFLLDGKPVDQILGVRNATFNYDQFASLALVNVTAPESGATVSGTFTASGVANSFEANVLWQVRQGDKVVASGFSTAEGWMDKLYPWEAEVDLSGLPAGDYTFVAMTDDPSDGEGFGPTEDTKTITLR